MSYIQSTLVFFGRLLISALFFYAAYQKITHWDQTVQQMAAKGLFEIPILLFFACLIEFLGGLSLVFGFKARLGALMLILFLVPATAIFHNFWEAADPERAVQTSMFLKNLAILGGLLLLLAQGAGGFSLDERS